MITIEKNKLNLIFGKVDSAKTTLILNTLTDYLKTGKEVLFFTPCTKSHHIEKKMHCLINDVDWISVKHDRSTLKPVDLILPDNLEVIDSCRDFDDIKATVREISRASKPSLLVIDNVNQIDFKLDLPYKERISKMFELLNKLAEDTGISILGSFYMLEIANWDDNNDFTKDDRKLGGMVLVQRTDRNVDVFDESVSTSFQYTINPRNMKLEPKEVPQYLLETKNNIRELSELL